MDFNATGQLTTNHIFCICHILEKKWEYNETVHQLFIDFKQACDSVGRKLLCNFLIEFGIPMKLVRLLKMCLNKTYSRVRVDKHLSDTFPVMNGLKQGDALSPLLCSFVLGYAIRTVQVNQDGLNLNGTHQLLDYADDVNTLGRSVNTVKKNTEALVVASKEIGHQGNADKTKYMVMSRDQNAGWSHRIKNDNSSFEGLEEFTHLGTTVMDENTIQEEIKIGLKTAVQHLLSSSLLSKNIKIKMYRNLILPVLLYGCATWSLT